MCCRPEPVRSATTRRWLIATFAPLNGASSGRTRHRRRTCGGTREPAAALGTPGRPRAAGDRALPWAPCDGTAVATRLRGTLPACGRQVAAVAPVVARHGVLRCRGRHPHCDVRAVGRIGLRLASALPRVPARTLRAVWPGAGHPVPPSTVGTAADGTDRWRRPGYAAEPATAARTVTPRRPRRLIPARARTHQLVRPRAAHRAQGQPA